MITFSRLEKPLHITTGEENRRLNDSETQQRSKRALRGRRAYQKSPAGFDKLSQRLRPCPEHLSCTLVLSSSKDDLSAGCRRAYQKSSAGFDKLSQR